MIVKSGHSCRSLCYIDFVPWIRSCPPTSLNPPCGPINDGVNCEAVRCDMRQIVGLSWVPKLIGLVALLVAAMLKGVDFIYL